MLVIAISDAPSSRQAVSLARSLNPALYILVRTRFVNEISELARLGANEVVPEEFETSIEIFARVLHQFKVPGNVIQREVRLARSGLYEMLREPGRDKSHSVRLDALEHVKMELISLPDNSPGCNATLSQLGVRQQFGVSVLAVYRGDSAIANPGPDQQLQSGDTLMVLGDDDAVTRATLFFDPGTDAA
jgi:CPA2 family monovalent cation:H+ antiporter-2